MAVAAFPRSPVIFSLKHLAPDHVTWPPSSIPFPSSSLNRSRINHPEIYIFCRLFDFCHQLCTWRAGGSPEKVTPKSRMRASYWMPYHQISLKLFSPFQPLQSVPCLSSDQTASTQRFGRVTVGDTRSGSSAPSGEQLGQQPDPRENQAEDQGGGRETA